MSRFEAEATIGRAAADVWSYAADIRRHPDWMAVRDARVVHGDGTDVGARGRERVAFGPYKMDVQFEVVQAEPGRRISWRSVDDPRFEWGTTLVLEPTGEASTRATYSADIVLRGPWRLLAPLVAMEGTAGVKAELMRLKANLESGAAGGSAGEAGA